MELDFPKIYQLNKLIGYGGNQDWFDDEWARRAGCASVLASNMYAYYHHKVSFQQDEFIQIMNKMFCYMTPGNMGYPFLYKFARTFVKIMEEEDCFLKPFYLKKTKTYKQAMNYVIQSINEGHPIGMLILHHRAVELEEDNWHWICLTGYQEKEIGYDIIFSDCGERRILDSRILFDIHTYNVFKMVRMKKDPKNEDQLFE